MDMQASVSLTEKLDMRIAILCDNHYWDMRAYMITSLGHGIVGQTVARCLSPGVKQRGTASNFMRTVSLLAHSYLSGFLVLTIPYDYYDNEVPQLEYDNPYS
ncbi:hypothetical protein BKA67DRAFT_535467 [Truncatella angustata]|uniref:Uncharacterized protein n=1 Tax=Truncatella angustata TaxID=152316 RepID=A0A9P8UL14_9PEZI|nr:uncharacterized protein BKA67DRAFT_535467 [Truncatella angustata]KAH6654133.1 hypothetical protein BKA67DRAFT_535467 [Truncatella angustata]